MFTAKYRTSSQERSKCKVRWSSLFKVILRTFIFFEDICELSRWWEMDFHLSKHGLGKALKDVSCNFRKFSCVIRILYVDTYILLTNYYWSMLLLYIYQDSFKLFIVTKKWNSLKFVIRFWRTNLVKQTFKLTKEQRFLNPFLSITIWYLFDVDISNRTETTAYNRRYLVNIVEFFFILQNVTFDDDEGGSGWLLADRGDRCILSATSTEVSLVIHVKGHMFGSSEIHRRKSLSIYRVIHKKWRWFHFKKH